MKQLVYRPLACTLNRVASDVNNCFPGRYVVLYACESMDIFTPENIACNNISSEKH